MYSIFVPFQYPIFIPVPSIAIMPSDFRKSAIAAPTKSVVTCIEACVKTCESAVRIMFCDTSVPQPTP